jgi:hypothetical protein
MAPPLAPNMKISQLSGFTFSRLSLVVPALLFGLWGGVILRLKTSGLLSELQNPSFHPLSIGTGLACLILALCYPFLLNPRTPALKNRWGLLFVATLLLAAPVIIYLTLPPDHPTTGFLARKYAPASSNMNIYQLLGVDQNDLQKDLQSRKLNATNDQHIELDMLELNFIANNTGLKKLYDNTAITLSGQCLPADAKDDKKSFRLVQMIMFCCAADAKVLGITVSGESGTTQSGTWLDVSGILHFKATDGIPYLVMEAASPEDDAPPPDLPLPQK